MDRNPGLTWFLVRLSAPALKWQLAHAWPSLPPAWSQNSAFPSATAAARACGVTFPKRSVFKNASRLVSLGVLTPFSDPSGVTVGGVATWACNVDGSLNAARKAIPANMVDQITTRALRFLLILRIDGITSPPGTRLGRRWFELTSREPHREDRPDRFRKTGSRGLWGWPEESDFSP